MYTIQLYPVQDMHKHKHNINIFTNKDAVRSVDEWLLELQPTKRGKTPWRFQIKKQKPKMSVTFVRYEDALAFRLKFGL